MSYKYWAYDQTSKEYAGTFDTCDTLPPGLYQVYLDNFGRPTAKTLTPRNEDFLMFENGPMTQVIQEIEDFWKSAHRYKALGVTHKRGLLLHGPHGCGKTGIISWLISDCIKRNALVISVTNIRNFATAIPLVRQIEDGRPVIGIFEDMERMCKYDEEDLLEVMDGASSLGDGILYIATTNKLDKIPARIKCRPSRIDTLIEVAAPNFEQRMEYLTFLLQKAHDHSKCAPGWASQTEGFSLAQLKELVLSVTVFQKSEAETIKRLEGLSAEDGEELEEDDD